MDAEETKLIDDPEGEEDEMSFLDHLEELRWRIIYSLLGIVVGTIIAWVFIDFIVDHVLLVPAKTAHFKLQNLKPFGQLFIYFQVAIIVGFVLSIPNFFYQFWKFIAPALKSNEKRYVGGVVWFSTFCFAVGIIFAYYLMLPMTLKFAAGFGSSSVENNFALDEYFSIVISILLGAGLVFELPMLSFFLSKIGILKPSFMRKYRRHALIAILFAAAILSPGTDPVSQILLTIPLVFLYEISIFVSKISQKKT